MPDKTRLIHGTVHGEEIRRAEGGHQHILRRQRRLYRPARGEVGHFPLAHIHHQHRPAERFQNNRLAFALLNARQGLYRQRIDISEWS